MGFEPATLHNTFAWRYFLFNKKFALGEIRTHNLLSHYRLLYQLSHFSYLCVKANFLFPQRKIYSAESNFLLERKFAFAQKEN